MLVDLGRDDIGKVAEFGTVETRNLMHIEKYSHVMHIVTNIAGRLKKGATMYDALKACLPAGTVAGAPKLKAMQVIDELEHENGESTPGPSAISASTVTWIYASPSAQLCSRTVLPMSRPGQG